MLENLSKFRRIASYFITQLDKTDSAVKFLLDSINYKPIEIVETAMLRNFRPIPINYEPIKSINGPKI